MGTSVPKQFLTLGGLPLLVHCLQVFEATPSISDVILSVPEVDREFCRHEVVDRYRFEKVRQIVAGGARRQDSVRHALDALPQERGLALVHDAVRPFLTIDMVERVIAKAAEVGAAITAIPMPDTVKRVQESGALIRETVDRGPLWLAQTPQVFRVAWLREAHAKALVDHIAATDDAQLVERLGHPVAIVEGSTDNIKVTRPEDLAIGEAILAMRNRR